MNWKHNPYNLFEGIKLFLTPRCFLNFSFFFITLAGLSFLSCQQKIDSPPEVIEIGNQRELFLNDFLVDNISGKAEFRLNYPTPQNIILEMNEPWEGNNSGLYVTVFQDGGKYRLYYRAGHISYLKGEDRPNSREVYCYAESTDGINWIKPELGLFSFNGSTKNNIILDGLGHHSFSPFKDTNPQASNDAKYKAFGFRGGKEHGLYAFKSSDGIQWNLMDTVPVITRGGFDSQNIAFWDELREEYRAYHRDTRSDSIALLTGIEPGRDIRTEHSQDFLNWSEPEFLDYTALTDPGNSDYNPLASKQDYPKGRVNQLYTNQIIPYYRAPHLLIGFPTRYIDRGWTESSKALPRYEYRQIRALGSEPGRTREGTAVTEGMIMSSRDCNHFWVWPEAFLRPGLREQNTWFYGDMYQAWGLVETKSSIEDTPPEISIYVSERARQDTGAILRRYSLRADGFVSLHAPLAGGEVVTKPFIFKGNNMYMNVSTSAAGTVKVEIQDINGQSIKGFTLENNHEIYGDSLDRLVSWEGNTDLSALEGKPVRLRFEIKDADIYSFMFR